MRYTNRNRRPVRLIIGLAAALLLVLAGSAIAAPALDRGFGEGGVVRTPLGDRLGTLLTGRGPLIEDLALQRGKLVGALGSGTEFPFLGAVRYRRNGELDLGFGNEGFVDFRRHFRGVASEAQGQAVVVQRDGTILLAGYRENRLRHVAPLLIKLLPKGRPDRSFGRDGLVWSKPRIKDGEVLHGVALQRSGRIVAAGARNERSGGDPAGLVIAYRPNGKLDRRFGEGGRVLFPHRREFKATVLRDIEVLPSGKLLVVGYMANRLFLARLRSNGGLDRGFGSGDGKVVIGKDPGTCCPTEADLEVLSNGRLVVWVKQGLFRFFPDGRLDRSFGRHGVVSGRWMDRVGGGSSLAVQGNGRIVVVGDRVRFRDDKDFQGKRVLSMLRALPNGKPDRGFGSNGADFLALGRSAVGTAALTLPGGRVVVGGGAQLVAEPGSEDKFEYELVLARLRR